jgi:hypothetical protein
MSNEAGKGPLPRAYKMANWEKGWAVLKGPTKISKAKKTKRKPLRGEKLNMITYDEVDT